MLVVSNTSPLSNLAIVGRLDLLQSRYGRIVIPQAVAEELSRLSHSEGRNHLISAMRAGWIETLPVPGNAPSVGHILDAGETEAVRLALALKADKILLDERRGRAAARDLQLPVAGILGELLYAKRTGSIQNVRAEMGRLKTEAHFFIAEPVERLVLSEAGEG
jgi:predicted nucleic acid-binding protein